jgi:hypothetical protein
MLNEQAASQNRIWRIVENEALILDPVQGDYFSVNPVGTTILKGLTTGMPLDVISEQVRKSHPGSPSDVPQQVEAFTEVLRGERLDLLSPDFVEDEGLDKLDYAPPEMHKYDQLHQVVAYSSD